MNSLQMQQQAEKADAEQATLLDLSGREVFADFYDAKTPVFLPNNPLHFKAHKLQILVDRLEQQATKNAAQFNSKNYLEAVDALMECFKQIREVIEDERLLEPGEVAEGVSEQERSPAASQRERNGMDSRISADNPFARPRVSAA